MIEVGVIGTGAIAQTAYLPAIDANPDANLECVVDLEAERAASVGEKFDASQSTSRVGAILDGIDAAIIATPPSSHAPIAEELLTAGVHVLTEKPIATTSEQARSLVDLATERDVHFAISRQLRESPACRTMRWLCHNGTIGTVKTTEIRFGDESLWSFASDYRLRTDLAWGGVLTDKAPHVLDFVLWLFGEDTTVVSYHDDSLGGLEANAELVLSVDGINVALEVTADRDIENRVTIRGDRGVIAGDPNGTAVMIRDAAGEELSLTSTETGSVHRFRPRVMAQCDRFLAAVGGGPIEYVPANDGVTIVEWIEEAYAAREQLVHPWEELPDDERQIEAIDAS